LFGFFSSLLLSKGKNERKRKGTLGFFSLPVPLKAEKRKEMDGISVVFFFLYFKTGMEEGRR